MSTTDPTKTTSGKLASSLATCGIVALVVLIAALFGIVTRPVGFLAAFWPPNPILLGMMVRWPKLRTAFGWIGAAIGYLTADLLTGSDFSNTLWLTTANLSGAALGTFLFHCLSEEHRRLSGPTSMLNLLGICTIVSATSAMIGAGNTMVAGDALWMQGFSFWFVGEFVNHLLLLSVVLTIPSWSKFKEECAQLVAFHRTGFNSLLPFMSLFASVILANRVGGPGAIAFVVPALMWCSINYRRFITACLTLLTLASILIADSAGLIRLVPTEHYTVAHTMSLRVGVALLALVPVMSSSIFESHQRLITQLSHSLQFDSLTEAFARKHFLQTAKEVASRKIDMDSGERSYCLMLDIDHFKLINDTFGHAVGDQVLRVFSHTVKAQLRRCDLFGRLGGEEFSVILSDTTADEAYKIAERIREQVEMATVPISEGRSVSMTVSIGIASLQNSESADMEQILIQADRALYTAKEKGRNQVHLASSDDFICMLEPV